VLYLRCLVTFLLSFVVTKTSRYDVRVKRMSSCQPLRQKMTKLTALVLLISAVFLWFSWRCPTRAPPDRGLVVWSNAYCLKFRAQEMQSPKLTLNSAPLLTRRRMHLQDFQLKCFFVNYRSTPPSIYRQQPSLDVDAAWKDLY
jgi:hypothetical protein